MSDIKKRGVANTDLTEPTPNRNNTETENVIKGKNNAFIVLGRDRPAGIESGYGGIGVIECGTIDLVAGLGGRDIKEKTGDSTNYYNNNFRKDAARVYISQRTDADINFEVCAGSSGFSKNKSAVVIKADDVRLIARETVKIVTRTDLKTPKGTMLAKVGGIELIAGNDDSDLQSMVKGENAAEAISDLLTRIKEINNIMLAYIDIQTRFNEKVATHVHIPPLLTQSTSTWYTSEGVSDKVIPLGGLGELTVQELMSKVITSLEAANLNCDIVKANYLNPASKKYINSKYNKTN